MNYELGIRDWKTIAAIAAIVLIGLTGFMVLRSPLGDSKEVVIREGQSVYAIADVLKEDGVIENKFVFVVYALVTGNETKLQAGKYVFKPGDNVLTVVYSLTRGLAESDDVIITIPEGFNVFDIDNKLSSLGFINEGEFAFEYYNDEGRFFPDTYRLRKSQITNHKSQTNPNKLNFKQKELMAELIEKMSDNFGEKTKIIFKDLNIQKQKEIIIVASILEKEAKTEEDMRLVAGVIKNRTEKGILLQVDATVAYGACLRMFKDLNISKFKSCNVAQIGVGEEIKIDGPYNTYTRAGLPPGPISNPGLRAISAALNPAETDYFYYLSTRDGSQVIFSKTAAEHAVNRGKYLGL